MSENCWMYGKIHMSGFRRDILRVEEKQKSFLLHSGHGSEEKQNAKSILYKLQLLIIGDRIKRFTQKEGKVKACP